MEHHLRSLGEGLCSAGHRVTVLTTRHPAGIGSEQTAWGMVHFMPRTRVAAYYPNWFNSSWAAFTEMHTEKPFDIVVSEGAGAERYARARARYVLPPLVSIMHGTLWAEVENHRHALMSPYQALRAARYLPPLLHHALCWQSYVRRASRLVAVSHEVRRRVLAEYHVDPSRVVVMPNGVDPNKFAPDPTDGLRVRQHLGIPEGDTLLTVLARLTPEKGTGLALEALNLLRERESIHLAIVGEGAERPHLEARAASLDIGRRVHFCGRIDHEKIPGYINAADIVVSPTLRMEGFPFALIEAMACEKAVVSSSFGGVDEILDNGVDGWIVPQGDVSALARAVDQLSDDPTLRQRIGAAARKKVLGSFTAQAMIEGTIALIVACAQSEAR